MLPSLATDIIARDKTASGFAKAEKRAKGFSSRSAEHVKKSGLGKLGEQIERLGKLRELDFGGGRFGASLSTLGRTSSELASGFGEATAKVVGMGAASETALGGVAAAAGGAAAAIAGLATIGLGAAAGAYMLGEKTAKAGAEIKRTSETFGVAAKDLQGFRAAGEQAGVSTDATTASVGGLSDAIYAMRSGQNNQGLAVLDRLGVKLKYTKDGAADTTAMLYDLADAIARQKDPAVQRAIARMYGVEGMLPVLRQGSAAMKAAAADYNASAASMSDAEVSKAEATERSAVRLNQHLRGVEIRGGAAAMDATKALAEKGVPLADKAAGGVAAAAGAVSGFIKDPLGTLAHGADQLGHAGGEAGHKLVEGAREAGHEFMEFVRRIEHQESGGHQFEFRKGRGKGPLISSAGAVGAMQVLEETGQRAAKKAGIAWDRERFFTDKAYNEQIGTAELYRLGQKYGGDEVLTAAAYNAGEGNVDKWIKRFGDPRTGKISDEDFAGKIPFKETRDYVANTAKAHVTIELKGAPAGTVSHVQAGPGVDVGMSVARGMDGP